MLSFCLSENREGEATVAERAAIWLFKCERPPGGRLSVGVRAVAGDAGEGWCGSGDSRSKTEREARRLSDGGAADAPGPSAARIWCGSGDSNPDGLAATSS